MSRTAAAADEALAHEASYRVRFDEAGPSGLVRTSGLLRYAQDVAWLHSAVRGFDREWYGERQLTWLVRCAELEVLQPIPLGATIVSKTAVVGHRRVWARRRGEFRLADGTLGGWVHTDWVMIDGRGALTRIPPIFAETFRIPEASGQIGRVPLGPTPADAATRDFAVRPHELDPMDHVNNAVYLDWFEEAIVGAAGGTGAAAAARPDATAALGAIPRRYRLEYAAAADGGASLSDAVWRDGPDWAYRVRGADGTDAFRAVLTAGGA